MPKLNHNFKRYKFKSAKAFHSKMNKWFGKDKEGWFFNKNEQAWMNRKNNMVVPLVKLK